MSNKLKYLLLLILPVILFLTVCLLKNAIGAYYLNFEDPSYVYLINSLNVSLRFPVGHFDHPGTTVQVVGAAVIRIYHRISSSNPDLIRDVLMRPEEYLGQINIILILMGSSVLLMLGILTYKLSGNIMLSLLMQLSPFVSLQIFYGLKIVASDNFLVTVSLCFTGMLIYYLYRIKDEAKTPLPFILIFAVICAAGLATKISFFPMLLIPLLLIKGTRSRLVFLIIVPLLFLIFVIPAISNYEKFLEWVWMLILFNGSYGHGDPSVVDVPKFFTSLTSIFSGDPVFAVSYFLSVLTLIAAYIKSKNNEELNPKQKKEFKLLLSIVLAMTIQVLIVAKQYRQHYMIPSLILSIFSFTLCTQLISSFFDKLKLQTLYAGLIIVISITAFFKISDSYYTTLFFRDEAIKVNRYVKENNSDALCISSFGSASKEFSLAYGISYSGYKIKSYKSILSEIQKENIFYIPWQDGLFSLSSKDSTAATLNENKKLLFQTNQDNVNNFIQTIENKYGLKIIDKKLLFSNSINECVYEITKGSQNENMK